MTLEILARLIADLYQQVAELNATVQQRDTEIDALTFQGERLSSAEPEEPEV